MLAKATPQAASFNPYAAADEGPTASLASSKEVALSGRGNDQAAAAPSTPRKRSKQQVEALVKADAGEEQHWPFAGLAGMLALHIFSEVTSAVQRMVVIYSVAATECPSSAFNTCSFICSVTH
jgi:hypothetical protein